MKSGCLLPVVVSTVESCGAASFEAMQSLQIVSEKLVNKKACKKKQIRQDHGQTQIPP
jgi:hypothetical protein